MGQSIARRNNLRLYGPHAKQLEAHHLAYEKRFAVLAWGRQSGKSTWALNHLTRRAWEKKRGMYWYILPTFAQCRVQYRRLKGMLSASGALESKSDSELFLILKSGSMIQFMSGGILDNLRTQTLDGVVVDEVRDCHPELWSMVLQPMLATTGGWAAFISTPNGFDQFYDLYDRAGHDPIWGRMQAPSTCNPLFTIAEADRLKISMTDGQYAQEIEAEFRDLMMGRAYHNFTDANQVTQNPFATPGEHYSTYLPIVVGMDFNVSPMHWTIGQVNMGSKQWHWEEEIHIEDSFTEEAALELVRRIQNKKNEIWICADSSGRARQRAARNNSDLDIVHQVLRANNVRYTDFTPRENPSIKERVNTVNVYCKNSLGVGRMTVNRAGCPWVVKDMQRVTWKKGAGDTLNKKDPTLTHAGDSIGYPIQAITPFEGVRDVGRLRVITR